MENNDSHVDSAGVSRRSFIYMLTSATIGAQETVSMFGDAVAYDRFMGRWSQLLASVFLDFVGVPDAGGVLDVGSGTGSLTLAVAATKPHCWVRGVDLSPKYVAYANSRTPPSARVTFERGDAQHLRFADARFDGTLALVLLNFVTDPGRAAKEMVRVTKRGHPVAAAVWDYSRGMRMLRLFWDSAVSVDPRAEAYDEKRMPLCRQGELSALWKKVGLTRTEERPLDIEMQFSSFADYWDPFLLGQGPAGSWARRIQRVDMERLRSEVKRRLPISSENEPFSLPARAWAVRGIVPV